MAGINYVDKTPKDIRYFDNGLETKEEKGIAECVAEIFHTPLQGSYNWDYNVQDDRWVELADLITPSMDHRGIVRVGDEIWILGGMGAGQQVTARVTVADLTQLLGPGEG